MSDNIPFEIQEEIINRLPIKSLLRFRTVSKAWKSFIGSSQFTAHYSSPVQSLLLFYEYESYNLQKYVSIVDDDTFPHRKVSPTVPPFVNLLQDSIVIGCSQGLICLYGHYSKGRTRMAVLLNLSIRKAVPVIVPDVTEYITDVGSYRTIVGFGVCRETTEPKIVKIDCWNDMLQVAVFTLSTGAWRRPRGNLNLPNKSIDIKFDIRWEQVVVDGCLYWLATDSSLNVIISFDLTSEELNQVSLPYTLANKIPRNLLLSKLRESLVMIERFRDANDILFKVWMMEDGVSTSFTKLFTFNVTGALEDALGAIEDALVLGFRKSGEPIIQISREEDLVYYELMVYEPSSKQMNYLGIDRILSIERLYPYMETLLLLDQPNFTEEEARKYLDDLVS